jgi:hypothetical protein
LQKSDGIDQRVRINFQDEAPVTDCFWRNHPVLAERALDIDFSVRDPRVQLKIMRILLFSDFSRKIQKIDEVFPELRAEM